MDWNASTEGIDSAPCLQHTVVGRHAVEARVCRRLQRGWQAGERRGSAHDAAQNLRADVGEPRGQRLRTR